MIKKKNLLDYNAMFESLPQHHWWTSEWLKLRRTPDLVDPLAAEIWIHSILFVIRELRQIEKFNIRDDSRWK